MPYVFSRSLAVLALFTTPSVAHARSLQEELARGRTAKYEIGGVETIHRIPTNDVVVVRLYLLGGTRQLTEETEGIEALIFRTAELDTRRAMARAGCRSTRRTGADWTMIGFTCLKADFDSAWAVFAQRVVSPALTETSVARARGELMSDAGRRYSNPDSRVATLAMQNAFAGHPYELEPLGTVTSLNSLTRDDLLRYVEEQFVQSRMLLVVVGDVRRSDLARLGGSTLANLPRGSYQWSLPAPVPRRRSSSWMVEHRELPTNYILGYFAGPSPGEPNYFVFRVTTSVLSSMLSFAVRTERSLSYVAYAPFLDRAAPVGGIYASTSDPGEVFPLMMDQISRIEFIDARGLTWQRFLNRYTLDQLAQNLTNEGQAEALGRAHLLFGDYTFAEERTRRLRRVRLEVIRRTALLYIRNIQYAYLGDTTLMSGKW